MIPFEGTPFELSQGNKNYQTVINKCIFTLSLLLYETNTSLTSRR